MSFYVNRSSQSQTTPPTGGQPADVELQTRIQCLPLELQCIIIKFKLTMIGPTDTFRVLKEYFKHADKSLLLLKCWALKNAIYHSCGSVYVLVRERPHDIISQFI